MAFWSKIQNELWDNYLGEIPENTGNIQEKKGKTPGEIQ